MKTTAKTIKLVPVFLFFLLLSTLLLMPVLAKAGEISPTPVPEQPVEITAIDYEELTMKLDPGTNSIVYISTDNKKWTEVDWYKEGDVWVIDISWVSSSSEKPIYLKGNKEDTVVSVTLPKKNTSVKVKFNKAGGDFEFINFDDVTEFQWRKSTDYTWRTVPLNPSTPAEKAEYEEFRKTVDDFRVKGAKLIFRTAQESGSSDSDVGIRSSKEVSVSISKRANAPSIKINVSKMTVNTSTSMEYYDDTQNVWISCEKNMSVEDLAPASIYGTGTVKETTIQMRKAAKGNSPHSKTALLVIPAQTAPPVIGDSGSDVTQYYSDGKLILQFNKATSANAYEYTVIKPGYTFDINKTSWKSVKSSKIIKISASTAPAGTTIYVRKKGITANVRKGLETALPSDYNKITVVAATN